MVGRPAWPCQACNPDACVTSDASARGFVPGRAPAVAGHVLAAEHGAATPFIGGLALVERAVVAALLRRVLGVLLGIHVLGVVLVAQGHGLVAAFVHMGAGLGLGGAAGEGGACHGEVADELAAVAGCGHGCLLSGYGNAGGFPVVGVPCFLQQACQPLKTAGVALPAAFGGPPVTVLHPDVCLGPGVACSRCVRLEQAAAGLPGAGLDSPGQLPTSISPWRRASRVISAWLLRSSFCFTL